VRFIVAALGLLLVAGGPGRAAAAPVPDGIALLEDSARRSPELAVAGRQSVTSWNRKGVERTVTQVYRSGHGQLRSEVLEPRSRRGRISVDDGHTRWSYDPRRRTLVHSSAVDAEEAAPDVSDLRQNYRIQVRPVQDRVAQRPAWVLDARAVEPGKPWRTLWLDAENGFPLKIEKHHADGLRQSVTAYETIQFPNSLPEGFFKRPLAHSGGRQEGSHIREERSTGVSMPTRPEDARAALGVLPPANLPAGYRLRSAAVIGTGPDAVYHLRYDDGWSVISLFLSRSRERLPGAGPSEKIALAHGQAQLHQDAHLTVLAWSDGPVHCALVGDVAPALLARIADASGFAAAPAARSPVSPLADLWLLVPALALTAGILLWSTLFILVRRRRSPA
jgi:outer membrane lipoprotein-sorting protein